MLPINIVIAVMYTFPMLIDRSNIDTKPYADVPHVVVIPMSNIATKSLANAYNTTDAVGNMYLRTHFLC